MSEPLIFSMSGHPRPKGRPRTRVVPAARGRPAFATIYTDEDTRKYEAAVAKIAALAMRGRKPFQGPLSVSIRFRLPLPQSLSKRDRAALLAGEEAYLGRADLTNYAKAIEDGLNGVVWADDVQIVRLFLTKAASDKPGVDIRVEPLGGED